jgi:multiple sugar transport system permease protein
MSLATKAPPSGAAARVADDGPAGRAGSRRSRFTKHVVLCLIGAVMMYPLLWLVSSSLKPNSIIFKDLSLWPSQWDPGNYPSGWTALEHPFSLYLVNSFIIVVLSIIGNLFSCSLAAYGFARLKFTGRKLFFVLMLGTMMLPGHVLLVPQYIVFAKLDWINTYYPLLVPNFLATNAFYIFLMVQFMRALPIELDDAARIDGCGPFRTFWRIIMPLSLPAFATTAIFTFISVWNEFFGPLIYLTDSELYTVPLALRQFIDSEGQSQWGQMFAMSFVSLAPVIGFFIAGQKYLIRGIATTGLK